MTTHSIATALLCAAVAASPGAAQEPGAASGPARDTAPAVATAVYASTANPFAGFETHHLQNGVRVWYRRLPDAPNTSVGVAVPYGSDQDPRGREELAHFIEHMLFSDHAGRTERAIKDEIEGRGGRRNAFTFPDHTFYYVTIGREHGLLALEWLGGILEPHVMDPAVVARNREPVANEVRARPRELGDWLVAAMDPVWLRMPGFWAMEFGLDTRSDRRWDRWAALQAIGPDDLRGFWERYYVPGAMTVTVVGDLPRDSVLAVAERAFGDLVPRPVPEGWAPPVDPGRYRRAVSWNFAATPRYRTIFKVFRPTTEDHLRLLFVRDLLDRRLEARLRFGERKAVYGVSVQVVQRGPVMYLSIEGQVDEEDLAWARAVVEEEIEALRRVAAPESPAGAAGPAAAADSAFAADRRALVERLISSNRAAEELVFQVLWRFYDRHLHADFPDLVAAYRGFGRAEIAGFARERLVRDRRVEWIWRPHPVGQAGALAGLLLLTTAAVRGAGRLLTRPVEMSRIRYVARIRLSLPFTAALVVVVAGGGVALLRLVWAGVERMMHHWVAPVDSWALQMGVMSLLGVAAIGLLVGWLSLVPRKILVFPDHVRVKHLAYRSRIVRPEDVRELSLRPFGSVWLSHRIFRTLPFTSGIMRPGIFLQTHRGPALYFRVRDVGELLAVMERVLSGREATERETTRTP